MRPGEGQTLAPRLQKEPLPVDEALEAYSQTGEGLEWKWPT
jgi:hypothetical protein